MACVDRTTEFSTIVNALKVRDGPSAIVQAPQPPGLKPGASDHARFTAAVAAIGREVHNTSMKVAEMAKLVKRRGTISGQTDAMDALTASIKADVNSLNNRLDELDAWCQSRGNRKSQTSAHSTSVVNSLKTQLMSTTRSFKGVLETRTETIKAASERLGMYGFQSQVPLGKPMPMPTWTTPHSSPPSSTGTAHNKPSPVTFYNPTTIADGGSGGGGGGQGSAFDPSFAFQQVSQQALMPQVDLYDQRARDVEAVNVSINEIGAIFAKLAHMVHEQGGLLERIDDDIETARLNMEAGEEQLIKKHNSLSYKWLAIKVFAILFLFIVLFLLFVA